MKPLEAHPMFNPAIKVSDAPQKEKKGPPDREDKEDISFSLFEQAEKKAPPEKGWNRHDAGTPGQWVLTALWTCLY